MYVHVLSLKPLIMLEITEPPLTVDIKTRTKKKKTPHPANSKFIITAPRSIDSCVKMNLSLLFFSWQNFYIFIFVIASFVMLLAHE